MESTIGNWLLRASWQSAILVGLVLAAQRVFRRQLTQRWRYSLWMLVVFRLMLPVSPSSPLSIFNLSRRPSRITESPARVVRPAYQSETEASPRPDFPVRTISEARDGGKPSFGGPARRDERNQSSPASTPYPSTPWVRLVLLLWFAGALFFATHVAWSAVLFNRSMRHLSPVTIPAVLELLETCRRAMGVRGSLQVLASPKISSPALWGFVRPRLILPESLLQRFSQEELRFVFLHELAHVKRGDIAISWLLAVLQGLHWFNPAIWFGFARMRAEREMACDALALSHADEAERKHYGQTIIKLLEVFSHASGVPGLVGILEDRHQMKQRILMIAKFKKGPRWSAFALCLLTALGMVTLTDARTDSALTTKFATNPPKEAGKSGLSAPDYNNPNGSGSEPGPGPRGIVLLPNGKPASEAEVGLEVEGKYIQIGKGSFSAYDAREKGLIVHTGSDGKFSLPAETGARGVIALCDQGYARLTLHQLKTNPVILLQSWGRIEGTLRIGKRLGTNELVHLTSGDGLGIDIYRPSDFDARTDEEGKFSLTFVPPGVQNLFRLIPQSDKRSLMQGNPNHIVVRAGGVTKVTIGGADWTVTGKAVIAVSGPNATWQNLHGSIRTRMPTPAKDPKTPEEFQAWHSSPEFQAAFPGKRDFELAFFADGSFQADDVTPGKFDLNIGLYQEPLTGLFQGFLGEYHQEIVIPEAASTNDDKSIDLGTVEIRPIKTTTAAFPSIQDALAGTKLTAAQILELESKSKKDPEDLSLRNQLLGYYSHAQFVSKEARQARQKHILWLIEHHPSAAIFTGGFGIMNRTLDGSVYEEAKTLWLNQVKQNPKNAIILGHAANFFVLDDRTEAEDLFKQAEKLEPQNPDWPSRLAELYMLDGSYPPPGAGNEAGKKALAQMEKAQTETLDAGSRFSNLDALARMAYKAGETEKARTYATEFLRQAEQNKSSWADGNAVHNGNVILGRIALREGKLDEAKRHLLAAGETKGSPQLNSFGPNMALAKELIEKGEKESVLAYFKSCAKFWGMGAGKLEVWTKEVGAGLVPDFGANLNY